MKKVFAPIKFKGYKNGLPTYHIGALCTFSMNSCIKETISAALPYLKESYGFSLLTPEEINAIDYAFSDKGMKTYDIKEIEIAKFGHETFFTEFPTFGDAYPTNEKLLPIMYSGRKGYYFKDTSATAVFLTLANAIYQCIRMFQKHCKSEDLTSGIPYNILGIACDELGEPDVWNSSDNALTLADEYYNLELDKQANAFSLLASKHNTPLNKDMLDSVYSGLKSFAKYYGDMWR